MAKRLFAVSCLVVLGACGGDSGSGPSVVPTPVPTPPPVSYSGTFSSNSMTYTSGGTFNVAATVAVTQTGDTLVLGGINVTAPIVVTYPLGTTTHSGGRFDGRGSYQSSGCGVVASRFVGYFSADGGIMNLTATLNSACGEVDIRGELRR